MKTIVVALEYGISPFWDCENATFIEPEELEISDELKLMLTRWTEIYDSILNMSDPKSSGFSTSEEREAFRRKGLCIFQQIKEELGHGYIFEYVDMI
ncbi:hypothetical protein [Crocosphaera sp. Alani8]|uniref:hypothetical protein n=1 Tax=Crocosphaera sp. Alani8 TaxID=3038952 RepID=UPI00313A85AA